MKRIMFIIALVLYMLPSNLSAAEIKPANTSTCFNYNLSADKETVDAGHQIKFTLTYESITPTCSEEELHNEQIVLDFSGLVDSSANINISGDSEIFDIEVSSEGIVTVKVKDWDTVHNTLESLSGDLVFTITVSPSVSGDVIINNNVGTDITINVGDGEYEITNTSKWADSDYANVGDIVSYNVRINSEKNYVENFTGYDTPATGLEYIPGSFYVSNYDTGSILDPNIFEISEQGSQLVFTNTQAFSDTYVLHYDMRVTEEKESYINDFEAIYDTKVDDVSFTVEFDVNGENNYSFDNGQIRLHKTNEANEPLSGAEFDVYDEHGNVVDHIITDQTGDALSENLAFGDYQLVETKAPEGYILDQTPIKASITDLGDDVNEVDVSAVNKPIKGQVDLHKTDENNQALGGVVFGIYNADTDQLVEQITTDANGYAISSELAYGNYYVKELKTNDDLILSEEIYPFAIENNQEVVHLNNNEAIINYHKEVIKPDQKLPIISEDKPEVEVITPEEPTVDTETSEETPDVSTDNQVVTKENEEISSEQNNQDVLADTASQLPLKILIITGLLIGLIVVIRLLMNK